MTKQLTHTTKERSYIDVAANIKIDMVELDSVKEKTILHVFEGNKKFVLTISEFNFFVVFELFFKYNYKKDGGESIRLPVDEAILHNDVTSDGKEYYIPSDIQFIIENLFEDYVINAKQIKEDTGLTPDMKKLCLLNYQQSMINNPEVMTFYQNNENDAWRSQKKANRHELKQMLRIYNNMSCKIFSIASKLFDRIVSLSMEMDEKNRKPTTKKV